MTVFSAALLLFLVMDPFGNIPFFISALKPVKEARRTRVIIRELLIALVVLVTFLFAGQHVLRVLGISEPALTVAGGTVLFLIAVKMVFPPARGTGTEEVSGEPFIVPLAIPYVAGPSAMAALLLIMNREPSRSFARGVRAPTSGGYFMGYLWRISRTTRQSTTGLVGVSFGLRTGTARTAVTSGKSPAGRDASLTGD